MPDWAERESNIAGDIPDYPPEWDSGRRVAAYWHALYHCGLPANTKSWLTVWNLVERDQDRRNTRKETTQ